MPCGHLANVAQLAACLEASPTPVHVRSYTSRMPAQALMLRAQGKTLLLSAYLHLPGEPGMQADRAALMPSQASICLAPFASLPCDPVHQGPAATHLRCATISTFCCKPSTLLSRQAHLLVSAPSAIAKNRPRYQTRALVRRCSSQTGGQPFLAL